ncbi:hypothetical protein ACFT0G_40250, partial [Streptomyces sp. NPDC057020]|uniref:hypothetical protein n=1 Tax=Streptomyces sp. NPDC057020 TaxID=3346002 RepID=UPI003632B4C6
AAGAQLPPSHPPPRTTVVDIDAGRLAFWAAIGVVTVVLELRRGSLGFARGWIVALVVGLPVLVLTERLVGEETLFLVPLWGSALLTLPGIGYLVAERRRAPGRTAAS